MYQKDLDLIRSKKPPWTGMLAVTEGNVLIARGDELILTFVPGLHAHIIEAMAVEFECIRVKNSHQSLQ